jgi:site-specific recombinase XerD
MGRCIPLHFIITFEKGETVMESLCRKMIEDMRIRNFSIHTQKAYVRYVRKFIKHFGRSPTRLSLKDIRDYQVYLVNEVKVKVSTLRMIVSALRFLYGVTLKMPWIIVDIPFPKKQKRLPRVLSREQVDDLLKSIKNIKHRTILTTCYAAGLRVSEAVGLRVDDIDSKRMVIRVRQGKRQKDRFVPLSKKLLKLLRKYWYVQRPASWLFPSGTRPDHHISTRSIARIAVKARNDCKLPIDVTTHTLRHCYATHLLESGVEIRTIQILLGHGCLRSTAHYTHLSTSGVLGTKSPFDFSPARA